MTTELIKGRPQLKDTDQLNRMAEALSQSSLCPAQYKGKKGDAFVAIVAGAEVGFQPMQALKSIAVINGRPSIYGDGLPAVAYASEKMKHFSEEFERDKNGNIVAAVVRIERRDVEGLREFRFSIDDAKRANLWGKKGPWSDYPYRMLQMRARGFAFRDCFADYLGGLHVAEEVRDYTEIPDNNSQEPDEHTLRFDSPEKPEQPDDDIIDVEHAPSLRSQLESDIAAAGDEDALGAVYGDIKLGFDEGRLSKEDKEILDGLWAARQAAIENQAEGRLL